MKYPVAATALALILGSSAMAQTATDTTTGTGTTTMDSANVDNTTTMDNTTMDNDMDMASMDRAELIRTRDITGGSIYTTNEANDEWSADTAYDTVGADWNEIGEIEDVVLDRQGRLIGIVAEVGGFLDIADKHVMLNIQDMRLVPVDDRSYSVVTRLSEEELEAMEGVDEGFWD